MAYSPGGPTPRHGGYDPSLVARTPRASVGDDWVARVSVGDWVEVEDRGGTIAGEVVHVGTSSSVLDPAGTRYARIRRSAGRGASEVDVAPPWQRLVHHEPGYRARADALRREGRKKRGDRAGVGRSRGGHVRVHDMTFAEFQAQAIQARQPRTSQQTVAMRPGGTLVTDPYPQATRTGAPNMSRTGVPVYKPATPRRDPGYSDSALRKRATSLARNILYGMSDGRGGLKEWGAQDIEYAYEGAVPYRWTRAILGLRSRYMPKTEQSERDYAAAILRILKSDTPEQTAESIAGESRTENRAIPPIPPGGYDSHQVGGGSGEWVVFYETGSMEAGDKRFHRWRHRSKKSAVADARKHQAEIGGHVVVIDPRGREVVDVHAGNRAKTLTRKSPLVSTKDVDFGEYKLVYLGDPGRGMANKYDPVWGVVTYGGKVVRGPRPRDEVRQVIERATGKFEEDLPHPKDWILGKNEARGASSARFDPSPLTRVKVITSHAGKSRFLRETDDFPGATWVKGYVPRQKQIPSPYAYSPTDAVHAWQGRPIIIRETAHKRYEVFELPPDMPVEPNEDALVARMQREGAFR